MLMRGPRGGDFLRRNVTARAVSPVRDTGASQLGSPRFRTGNLFRSVRRGGRVGVFGLAAAYAPGGIPLACGLLVVAFNLYARFIRHTSGMPIIGTVFAVIALAVNFGCLSVALGAIVVLITDRGGLPAFLIATWCDASWDATAHRP